MPELWIGTNNPKKLKELTRLLAPLGVTLRTPQDLDAEFDPVEDRPDFAGNVQEGAPLQFERPSQTTAACGTLGGRPACARRAAELGLDDRGRYAAPRGA